MPQPNVMTQSQKGDYFQNTNNNNHIPSPSTIGFGSVTDYLGGGGLNEKKSRRNPYSKRFQASSDKSTSRGIPSEHEQDLSYMGEDEESMPEPTPAQLVLLSLDYLRVLLRESSKEELSQEGLKKEPLSVAVYALSRSFMENAPELKEEDDCWNILERENYIYEKDKQPMEFPRNEEDRIVLPDLKTIQNEIFVDEATKMKLKEEDDEEKDDDEDFYDYDDSHISNTHRFFLLNGLASGPPLSLSEITLYGLTNLGSKSRLEAEKEIVQSPLFDQFVSAVREKGFFKDADMNEINPPTAGADTDDIFKERYRKVVAKFRTKLAGKAEAAVMYGISGKSIATTPRNDIYEQRIPSPPPAAQRKLQMPSMQQANVNPTVGLSEPSPPVSPQKSTHQQYSSPSRRHHSISPGPLAPTQIDLAEAEKHKQAGNAYMSKREYKLAIESYTTALKLCPAGSGSHVYFSNRAAALLSLKQYKDAILDSERSLSLKPDYGKAYARLGLAHYLLGEYEFAVKSYNSALKYEPENKSSLGYLEKAQKRLSGKKKKNWNADNNSVSGDISVMSNQQRSTSKQSPEHKHSPAQDNKPASTPGAVSNNSRNSSKKKTSTNNKSHSHSHQADQDLEEEHEQQSLLIRQREADQFKSEGNTYMTQKNYSGAIQSYTHAIQLCPSGPNSHVYYSNRAAALCYLEKYHEAEWDSERSLKLNPEYGKAHARLGLARFFLGDYEGSVEAYKMALRYDPNNVASRSYLAKAERRLESTRRKKGIQEEHDGSV